VAAGAAALLTATTLLVAAAPASGAVDAHTVTIDPTTVINDDFYGVGVDLIPVALMPNNRSKGYDEAYWQMDLKRIQTLQPKVARVWFQPDWFEPAKGVFDFETEKMDAFMEYLDALEASGTEIELNYGWKVGRDIQEWFSIPGVTPGTSAPADLDDFAEGASVLLHELIEDRGYDNIKYLTFYNEPNGSWDFEAPGSQPEYYASMVRTVHDRLVDDGLRDLVDIWGPEEWNSVPWTQYMRDHIDDVLDAYSFHVYGGTYDSLSNEIASRRDYVSPKPVVMSEFGFSGTYDSWWGAGYGNYVIKAANEGLSAALVWQLNGVWVEDPDEGTDTNGTYTLWDSLVTAKSPNPRYYEAGPLMRYIPAHSEVLSVETDSDDVRAAAFRGPDGEYTVVVETNESTAPRELTVDFSGVDIDRTFHRVTYTESVQPEENALLPAASASLPAGSSFTDTVNAERNVVVYTTTDPETQVAVEPVNPTVTGGDTLDLDATVIDGSGGVTWSVVGDDNGTIDASGVYTSPAVAEARLVAVRAVSTSDPTSSGVALVRVEPAHDPGRADAPVFDHAAGTYAGSVDVAITSPTPGAEIRYTTDGTAPDVASAIYTGPLELTSTTKLTAIAFADGLEPSPITTALFRVVPSTAGPDGSVQCATEGSICAFAGVGTVYYGANGGYLSGVFERRVECSASVFGGDPAPGLSKRCYVLPSTADHATKPAISPAGGSYDTVQQVTITSPVTGAELHYTDDGSMPTAASALYTVPLAVASTKVIKAIAVEPGKAASPIAVASFQVIDTSGGPDGFTYCAHQFGTCALTGPATVSYGIDGSYLTGVFTDDVQCNGPSFGGGDPAPNQVKKCFFQAIDPSLTLPPTFTPPAGAYTTARMVTIASTTPGSAVHYTVDGSAPTESSPLFTAPIEVATNTTVKAIATSAERGASPVVTANYVIGATPGPNGELGPDGYSYCTGEWSQCAFTGKAAVAFGANGSFFYGVFDDGALCTPTTFGGDPAFNQAKACFFAPIDASTTLPPTFTPGSGAYSDPQQVTIASATPGAEIRYTTDGSKPTASSTLYDGPITVATSLTVRAIATAPGLTVSPSIGAKYTIDATVVATPVFSPLPGTYATGQQVTLSSPTAGASVHYTTDGSTPTAASTLFTAPIAVASTTTIKAIAVKAGIADSATTEGTFIIGAPGGPEGYTQCSGEWSMCSFTGTASVAYGANGAFFYGTFTNGVMCVPDNFGGDPAFNQPKSCYYQLGGGTGTVSAPTFSPAGGSYSAAQQVTLGTSTPGATVHYTTDGSTPTADSALFAGPITVATTTTLKAIAVKSGLTDSAVMTATYVIGGGGPAGYTECSGEWSMCSFTGTASVAYGANGSYFYGTFTDGVMCVPDNFGGDPAFNQAKRCYYLLGASQAAATPSFSPPGGSYATTQHVTLSSATPGAAIRYTLDGSTPTATSAAFSAPIEVATSTTIKAIAIADGLDASPVGTAVYTILPTGPAGYTYCAPEYQACTFAGPAAVAFGANGSFAYRDASDGVMCTTDEFGGDPAFNQAKYCFFRAGSLEVAATPVISPDGGSFTEPRVVTIESATGGAVIRYTLDGTVPTPASALYTAPLTVSTTQTVTAVAFATGYAASAPVSAHFVSLVADTDDLTDANRGDVSGPDTVTPGQPVRIGVGDGHAGATLHPTLFSTPVYLGPVTATSAGTILVTIPASTPAGAHRLAVLSADGSIVGWYAFQVVSPAAAPTALGDSGTAAVPALLAALTLLLAGAAALGIRASRRERA
jgi:hypothetical protein